jgi:hypothetical protein
MRMRHIFICDLPGKIFGKKFLKLLNEIIGINSDNQNTKNVLWKKIEFLLLKSAAPYAPNTVKVK